MAHIGTYYFNGSGKKLLRYNRSTRAALAKYRAPRASSNSITFSTLFTAPTPYLFLSTSKQHYKALPKREQVKIDFNSFSKDLFKADKVIAAKVPCFSTTRIYSSFLTGFSSATTKKF